MPEFNNLCSVLDVCNSTALMSYEWIDHSVPANLKDEVAKLTPMALTRARVQNHMLSSALFREDFIRSNKTANLLHDQMSLVKSRDEQVLQLKAEVSRVQMTNASLTEEITTLKAQAVSANEAMMRAEAELKSSKALAEKGEHALKELEAAKKSLAESQLLLETSNAEKRELAASSKKAEEDLERLRTAIPSIFSKAIKSHAVMDPFTRLIDASTHVGGMEMLKAISEHVTVPKPFPPSVAELMDPDSYEKQEAAVKEMHGISVPFIEEIGGPLSISVDEILAMEP